MYVGLIFQKAIYNNIVPNNFDARSREGRHDKYKCDEVKDGQGDQLPVESVVTRP